MMNNNAVLAPGTLEILAATPAVLASMLGTLPDSAAMAPGPGEGWSPRDVVAHMLSVHGPAFVERVRTIVEGDHALVPNVDEEETLERSGLRARPLAELLARFAEERAAAMTWLRGLGPSEMAKRGRHSVAGDVSAADIVHHVAYHDLLHIDQICRMLRDPIDARRGAMRAF